MKTFRSHIIALLLGGLMSVLGSLASAQTPAGTRIDNVATVQYRLFGGEAVHGVSDTAKITVEGWGVLTLNKTVSRDTVGARDTVRFTIAVGYDGNLFASQVVVTDTVPSQFIVLSASRGTVNGNIISWNAGTISAAHPDSVVITAVVRNLTPGLYPVVNTATSTDSTGTITRSSAPVILKVLQTETCVIGIDAASKRIVGNGQQWAAIRAHVTDSLGVPKPDGTPVLFRTDLGSFSNGKDTVTHFTMNGFAIDSLNAKITSSTYVEAKVVVTLLAGCNVSDTLEVVFYPGAITGVVLDNVTKKFYRNAYVRLIDSTTNTFIDADTTGENGKFLMFVPRTATYRVDVSASDKFALENTVTTYVPVDITGSVTQLFPNKNAVSGTVYYWISNTPIYIPNMPLELFDITAGDDRSRKNDEAQPVSATVLKTVTDDRGVYEFVDIKPGKYKVVIGASELNGLATITIPENGYYILNGNIPVELTSVPTIQKSGTPEVFVGDTARYSISVRNPNAFKVRNVIVADTLHTDMTFVSATDNGVYDPVSHTIVWKLGDIDSSYRKDLSTTVRIAAGSSAAAVVNKATLFTNETLPLSDTAKTALKRVALHSIVKTVNKDSAAIGDTLQYRIVVRNNGTAVLPNMTITDTIDAQKFTVLLVSSNAVLQNNIVTATEPVLTPGDSMVVQVRVRVKETAPSGFRNIAYASADITPVRSADVLTPWNQNIAPNVANLLITKSVSKDTVVNGDTLKYIIRVRNNGTKNLTNVVVTDTLPKQVTKAILLYSNGVVQDNVVMVPIGPLPVGAEDSVVIVATMAASPYIPERVTNIAHATANETGMVTAEANILALIGKLDRLLLHITASSPTVFTGDTLNYVLRVTNVSNRKLTNVIVRDPVPFQLENIRVEDPNSTRATPARIRIVSLAESGLSLPDSLRLEGSVAYYQKDTIDVGEVDSFYVKTTVRLDRPNFELILNTGYATTDQTKEIIAQAVTVVEPRSPRNFQLQLIKSVSKDTVHIGDTMMYVIRMKNITAGPITKLTVMDTLPPQIINPRLIGHGKLEGNVVTYELGLLASGKTDSIVVVGQLDPYNTHDGELVLNYAFARAFQIEEQTAYAIFVAKTDPACRIIVTATPDKIVGNGRSKAFIEVRLTNTLGYPKPDGSPVVLTTTAGQFGNGQSMRVLYTKDGVVSDSLRATVSGSDLVNAMAIASADDGQGCRAKDTVNIVFYPGAIEGTVIDHRTNLPVLGAIVRAYSKSTDSLLGQIVTKADGYYLFPVTKTDSFNVFITTLNEFNRQVTVQTNVTVNVSGLGDDPTPNQNSVSGAVYYLVSHEPIPAANLSIVLQQFSPGTEDGSHLSSVDSTVTDSAGTYKFDRIPAGQFRVLLNHPTISNAVELLNSGNGQYVINANIAVVLNPNIVFDKSGPSRIALNDTASYRITVQNTGNLSTTNTITIDSLHWSMQFVSASNGGVYEPAAHRIVWNLGKLDSQTTKLLDVKVRFLDTLKNTLQTLNRASITSNQTTIITDSVPTLLFLPPTMQLWKVADVHRAAPGDTVVYTVKLKNVSGSFADSVIVMDRLPSQVRYLASGVRYYRGGIPTNIGVPASYDSLSHTITWKRDTVFVGDSADINIVTMVRSNLEPGSHEYTNIAGMEWKGGILSTDQNPKSDATVRSFVSYLRIAKQAMRKVVEIGDIETYMITVTNTSAVSVARDIQVLDKLPFGFRYIAGSTFIDSLRQRDPSGRNELLWLLRDSLAPGASIRFVYRLTVGAGAVEGNGINRAEAFARSQFGEAMTSGEVTERVEVRRGVFTTHGLIIGKVFYDDNRNRYQDSSEAGVKGVELMMEDGTRIITGDDGKYSLPDVLPGEHVIRVRTHTLPKESALEMGYNDFARDSTSRFVRLTESGIARVDFYLVHNRVYADSLQLSQSFAKIGDFSFRRIASPRNIVFIEDKRLASMKLTGLNFEVGKAILKPEAFVTLKQLADILREYPDQPLTIAGHTDSMKIATAEFPNNKVLSMARSMSVKNYLVEKEGINVDRISIEGYGETRPLATNKSIDGRSLNRRVEFYFTPTTEDKPVTEMPVSIEIPIEYSGTENVSKVDFRDVLAPGFTFVPGSATFAGAPVKPVVDGNELHWTLNELGPNFRYLLRYTVMVARPDRYEPTEIRSSSASICYYVGDSALKCIDTLTTVNEVAVAVKGRAVNFVMSGVLFDVGKATLRSAALSSLETTAKFLKDDPTATALIEGHTDSSPIHTKEFPSNIELSQARANTIRQKLISGFGIEPERLKTAGFGEFRPIASNISADGRQLNRRIEMRILRSEFVARALPEGGVDSSLLAVETLLPKEVPANLRPMLQDKVKERYILTLTVKRNMKRNTVATTIVDTIPAGLRLIETTLTSLRGVDSIAVNGNVITVRCAPTDSVTKVLYVVDTDEVAAEAPVPVHDGFTVVKRQSDGTIIEERTTPVVIELTTKRTLVRNQR